jgi:hypothetical protein
MNDQARGNEARESAPFTGGYPAFGDGRALFTILTETESYAFRVALISDASRGRCPSRRAVTAPASSSGRRSC